MKAVIALIIFAFVSVSLAADAPQWTGNYVNDYAGVLGNRAELEGILRDIERNLTIEFAVVTISALPPDETKETYSYKIFNEWGIGKKSENNGLLLLIIANGTPGSRMRIEVGYGIEGYITDAAAGRALDHALPYYEKGDYSGAAYIVVSDIQSIIENKGYASGYNREGYRRSSLIIFLLPFIFVFFIAITFIAVSLSMRPECSCGSRSFYHEGNYMICKKCKKKIKIRRMYRGAMIGGAMAGGGFGGGGAGR
ncbi:MAG: TPM domain-containing protein [Candidatus Aenigmarchaeota archaeon]|nr:TPM domain-containing protein [Candidatus Aenigmarchaeota archaeon]MDI6722112.1 TPM domain-containing protein [Candidatus Aenigmarchaeota archaeon]